MPPFQSIRFSSLLIIHYPKNLCYLLLPIFWYLRLPQPSIWEKSKLCQPFVCMFKDVFGSLMCKKSFSTRDEIKEYVRTTHYHFTCTLEGCPVANIFFTHSKQRLTIHHERMTQANMPRICKISRCPQFTSRFKTEEAVLRHERSVHKPDTRIMEMVNKSNTCRDPDGLYYFESFENGSGFRGHVRRMHGLLRVYSCDSPQCAKWNLNTYHRWNSHKMDCKCLESSRCRPRHLPNLQAS
ncbi:hypothetical protein BKA61DRAFT_270142 [Leptodontidium sp. MPI-SDFR-AT-0119]|nr:hypothetical protein BKA61DRAFT_270142 [Leptodontidium sp. MPI-SDFR-AT-0119]